MSYNHSYDTIHSYRPEQDWRDDLEPPVSPISANASLSSLRQAQYGHQVDAGQIRVPNRSVSPIKDKQPRYYSQMPPPPRHDGQPQAPPTLFPRRSSQAPYMPTASDFSPPDPERRALNDIDNIFGPRDLMSPSPEPQDLRAYVTPQYPSTPPVHNRRPKPQQQAADNAHSAYTTRRTAFSVPEGSWSITGWSCGVTKVVRSTSRVFTL
jgi:hypothetical protein